MYVRMYFIKHFVGMYILKHLKLTHIYSSNSRIGSYCKKTYAI